MKQSERRHFCRTCTASFDPTPGITPTAHTQAMMHARREHRTTNGINARCDKHCKDREQPDEHQHGVRLYGPGAARLSTVVQIIRTYDELFPPEEEVL